MSQLDNAIDAAKAVTPALWVEHDKIPDLEIQRIGNSVYARYKVNPKADTTHSLQFDKRLYFNDLFEYDSLWTLVNTALLSAKDRVDLVLEFESIHDRTKTMSLNSVEAPVSDAGQTVEVMGFVDELENKAWVTLGHVGAREFKRALNARSETANPDIEKWRYEYAVFRDDESIVFNVRPDETDAKPVTVLYLGDQVSQL